MARTTAIGSAAENLAEAYVTRQGVNCVARNYRSRYGEVDLIGFADNTWIFIEVKNRKNNLYGTPAEAVTPSKQKKIIATAQFFLLHDPSAKAKPSANVRFDVISIENLDIRSISWLKSAFDCEGY